MTFSLFWKVNKVQFSSRFKLHKIVVVSKNRKNLHAFQFKLFIKVFL